MAAIRSGVTANTASIPDRFLAHEFHRRAAGGADKAGLAPVSAGLETPVRAAHEPWFSGKVQCVATICRAADFTGLAAPNSIMAMAGTDQSMCDFMKNRVADMRPVGVPHIMAGQRNLALPVIALSGTPPGMIQPDAPPIKAMHLHQRGGQIKGRLQRPHRLGNRAVSWPHASPAI